MKYEHVRYPTFSYLLHFYQISIYVIKGKENIFGILDIVCCNSG